MKNVSMAEEVLIEFRAATRTISIPTLAKKRGVKIERERGEIKYTFSDKSVLHTRGRGVGHHAITY